jgi:taurine dioxygenase
MIHNLLKQLIGGRNMTPTIEPFDTVLGAEVRGIDLSEPMDDEAFAVIERAYNEHSVLLFRAQELTPEQHVAFSRRFGHLEIHVLDQWRHPEHPEILIVSNLKDGDRHVGVYNAGRYWHTDLSYMQAPSRGSLLYAIEVPEGNGQTYGDTQFASTTAAYDALSDHMKERISGLRATFSLSYQRAKLKADGDTEAALTDDQIAKTPVATHRIVQTHPVTGRKLLFINEGHTIEILDLPAEEGKSLLEELCRQCTRPEFVYRHRWQVGDVLMWDNIPTQHLALFDYALPQRRYMHRTTLTGVELE